MALIQDGYKVKGIDVAKYCIERAKENSPRYSLRIPLNISIFLIIKLMIHSTAS